MDLSFARLHRRTAVTALPTELAVLLASAAGRQGASRTARAQARLASRAVAGGLMRPSDGRFDRFVAAVLARAAAVRTDPVSKPETEVKQPFT